MQSVRPIQGHPSICPCKFPHPSLFIIKKIIGKHAQAALPREPGLLFLGGQPSLPGICLSLCGWAETEMLVAAVGGGQSKIPWQRPLSSD